MTAATTEIPTAIESWLDAAPAGTSRSYQLVRYNTGMGGATWHAHFTESVWVGRDIDHSYHGWGHESTPAAARAMAWEDLQKELAVTEAEEASK